MNTHTEINELKANGEYFAAGVLAARLGHPEQYGTHFGTHTSLSFARSEFAKGWHSMHSDTPTDRAVAAAEAAQEAGYAVRASVGDVTPTADELVAVAALNSWLVDHYEEGAHWIVETTSDNEHVAKLRELGMSAYRAELRAEWELTESYAFDIRNS
jgi:hypothetical protein